MPWRPVPGYASYEVSDAGQVRHGKLILKPTLRGGRMTVNLNKQQFSVARLVLLTFVGPAPPNTEARHYPDRDINNNRLSNLSWASRLMNQHDRKEHLTDTHGERHGMSKLTWEQVRMLRSIKDWPYGSKAAMARKMGLSSAIITQVLNGDRWKE